MQPTRGKRGIVLLAKSALAGRWTLPRSASPCARAKGQGKRSRINDHTPHGPLRLLLVYANKGMG